MISVNNIYGFTGTRWEIPDIDSLSTGELIANYSYVYYTLEQNGRYYLGTMDSVRTDLATIIARAALVLTQLTTEIEAPLELISSKYRGVYDAAESNMTLHFPSSERVVINGGRFIPTEDNGESRYVIGLGNDMIAAQDSFIASSDIFLNCEVKEITAENLTTYFQTGLLLVGGILIEIRSLYDYLGTGVNLKGNLKGWLPTLFKKISPHINPYEMGLTWPIQMEDLKSIELWNRIIDLDSSRLIAFNSPTPVEYNKRRLSALYSDTVESFICFGDRPSNERVTKLIGVNRTPTKKALYPTFVDTMDTGLATITIEQMVDELPPEEHTIKYINYEVLT